MTLTKCKLKALEKVFAAEIENRLPFCSRAGIYRELCDEGLLMPMERVLGGPPFPVRISGFQLSHAGRFAYCVSCDAPKTSAPKPQRRRAPVA